MSDIQHDEEARARSRKVAQRLKDDAAFRQQVESDPFTALREAGVPEDAHVDFMRETGIEADVTGYQGCRVTCEDTCFVTCWVTSW